ncbi:MAG: dihydroorotate dehydrogenase electron transfer subunit, partial [Methanotrichaceae archaeon]|nr:dihydroorotate dehydrogenase electron transfer subunit [Methanotrichaceae archaeon]
TLKFANCLDPAPGQYIMVWIRGVDEIPMSFSKFNEITVHAIGHATKSLIDLKPGDYVGLRGPIGRGFVLKGDNILLVGGGVGVAPLAFLGEQARSVGINVTSLIGFRSSNDAILCHRFETLGPVVITTDDGSLGINGRVTKGLKDFDLQKFSQIYICGPELMIWDIISRTKKYADRIQACINRYFKCAIGICGSCCMDPEGVKVCVEGPVIMANNLLQLQSEFGRYKRDASGSKGPCRG